MQQTIQLQRSARRAFSIQSWLNAKSGSFSLLMGETVTRRQVAVFHLAGLFILMTALTVETSLAVSIASAAGAGLMVRRFNKLEKGGEA